MIELKLPFEVRTPVLACGADLKSAFAFAEGCKAYLFDGFGDLSDPCNYRNYARAVEGARKRLDIAPDVVVCDLHPGYFSTKFAGEYARRTLRASPYGVQHHEAHVASVMTDSSVKGNVFAAAFDGTGYGHDGNIWGGEFFTGNAKAFKRVGHLDYAPMPGMDAAIMEPRRMALSYLYAAFGDDCPRLGIAPVKKISGIEWNVLKKMMDKKINSPLTSSMGRLFDAVACLVLKRDKAAFEAELPIELEKIADPGVKGSYSFASTSKLIKGVVKDIKKGVRPGVISAKFHNSAAELILDMAGRFSEGKVVLSGGVFQNRFLSGRAREVLRRGGFDVYTHSNVPANDSGIPIGQIAIANARLFSKRHICV